MHDGWQNDADWIILATMSLLKTWMRYSMSLLLGMFLLHLPAALHADSAPVRHELTLDHYWRITMPNGMRFDTSGLAMNGRGELFTVHDRNPEVWQIHLPKLGDGVDPHVARVEMLTNSFTPLQLFGFIKEKKDRYDTEGVSFDKQGWIYSCEEANRWILRFNPDRGIVERLPIDWSPVSRYFSSDPNSSFEGLAVGNDNLLYVANERDSARIMVVDLGTFKVIDNFKVSPKGINFGILHYSDLAWHRGFLYVLCRHQQVVLKVEPRTHQVTAEYHYKKIENTPEHRYNKSYPTGVVEGLSVDDHYIWLITDNNCEVRKQDSKDRRPTLFRCLRMDAVSD